MVPLVSLLIFELSLLLLGSTTYLKGERSFGVFLSSRSGLVFVGAIIGLVISGAVIVYRSVDYLRSQSRNFRLVVAMNLVTVVLILVTGEIAVRASVHSYHGYEAIGTLLLKPKNWEAIRGYYLKHVEEVKSGSSFYTFDSNLGWTIRPNSHTSYDGLSYWSSAEGLRAPGENVSFPRNTEQTDIALVGDSFTFGEEVGYEETYAHYLQQMLGSQFRVLNFGVPGYGVGQMFLSYKQEVRAWKPRIVILGFISHDVKRTLWVYTFLGDMRWKSPFPNPRFILRDGELVKVTESLPTPEHIFARASISELPQVEFQKEYRPGDWEERFYHVSYLIRLFEAWASRLNDPSATISDESLESINAALLTEFVTAVKQEGSIPLVVFLPVGKELTRPNSTRSLGKQVLERAGIDYVDPTSCLLEVDPADRQQPRLHYTAQGNAAVAKCVYKAVKESLPRVPFGPNKLRTAKIPSSK
jgi:hypothetical protein